MTQEEVHTGDSHTRSPASRHGEDAGGGAAVPWPPGRATDPPKCCWVCTLVQELGRHSAP